MVVSNIVLPCVRSGYLLQAFLIKIYFQIQLFAAAFDQAGEASSPGPESRRVPFPEISAIHIEPSVVEKVSHLESGEKEGARV